MLKSNLPDLPIKGPVKQLSDCGSCLSLFSPLFAMRRSPVRSRSRPPSFQRSMSVANSILVSHGSWPSSLPHVADFNGIRHGWDLRDPQFSKMTLSSLQAQAPRVILSGFSPSNCTEKTKRKPVCQVCQSKRPRVCQTVLPQHARTSCYAQVDAGNGLERINPSHKSDSGTSGTFAPG